MTRLLAVRFFMTCVALSTAAALHAAPGVWTDPQDPTLPADFKVQGEYTGDIDGGGALGAQVIALGKGAFQAVFYPGGLPGAGWDGKTKLLADGMLDGGKVEIAPAAARTADGKPRKYLAQSPAEFLAVRKFPEQAQTAKGVIADGAFTGVIDGKAFKLHRTIRQSPTMGAKPPTGAIVLFDGSSKDEWKGGRLDEKTRLLNTDGSDISTKRKFLNYSIHVEFMLPYRPDARGQGRGNSGFYQVDLYEVQILDSFGLDGVNNECGGVYSQVDPKLNMCLPPLQWQTYDVDFTSAVVENGKKTKNAVLTVKLNGVVIHENQELKGVTGGARQEPEGTPGPIKLQGHGNPLQFRNIWIVER
jgi:hypothetical protein